MLDSEIHSNRLYIDVIFRCYAELNDFLSAKQKYTSFNYRIKTPAVVSEAITSIGIPLSEVDLILVNSTPVERFYRLSSGDYISVYPVFESFDISSLKNIEREPLRKTKFIADAHLGKLTKYLRMLGFDTLYRNDFGDDEIINISLRDKRIILTRDKRLLNSRKVTHGYYIRAIDKHEQLTEVVNKFDLISQFKPFIRCMTCNSILVRKSPDKVKDLIGINIAYSYEEFYYCESCHKVFWKGSHFKRMESQILDIARKK